MQWQYSQCKATPNGPGHGERLGGHREALNVKATSFATQAGRPLVTLLLWYFRALSRAGSPSLSPEAGRAPFRRRQSPQALLPGRLIIGAGPSRPSSLSLKGHQVSSLRLSRVRVRWHPRPLQVRACQAGPGLASDLRAAASGWAERPTPVCAENASH